MSTNTTATKVALITGGARRVGATTASTLHAAGYTVAIHYRSSAKAAEALQEKLNHLRPNSAFIFSADLNCMEQVEQLAEDVKSKLGQLDLLVNNASSFYPTPIEQSTQKQWDDLINSNLRAPYFLTASLSKLLRQNYGCIINMIDIHSQRGLPGYPIYSIAKAGLEMMTKSLAKELAPEVRVNGVSPGAILWPEQELEEDQKQSILDKTLLQRIGSPEDLAQAIVFLASAEYITGQVLAVDGGKSLFSH
ncbi:pteridine reductase [Neptuniibacter sp. QD72_48]|uniref:pteridine reductase n=1 Tax=unclassified Neptuniibacter TaxID=2630693 RepID=UPI0039F45531